MNKNKNKFVLGMFLMFMFFLIYSPNKASADNLIPDSSDIKTIPYIYVERDGKFVKEDWKNIKGTVDMPIMVRWDVNKTAFKKRNYGNLPGHLSDINSKYQSTQNLYLNTYGDVIYYSVEKPEQERTQIKNYNEGARIHENYVQSNLNPSLSTFFSRPFVDRHSNTNIKKGRFKKVSDWNIQANYDPNGGNMYFGGSLGYEWRYLGYDVYGDLLQNLYFPADYAAVEKGKGPSGLTRIGIYHKRIQIEGYYDYRQDRRSYFFKPWDDPLIKNRTMAQQTEFNQSPLKDKWMRERFYADPTNPSANFGGNQDYVLHHKVLDSGSSRTEVFNRPIPTHLVIGGGKAGLINESVKYFKDRTIITGNPELSSVPMVMWHKERLNNGSVLPFHFVKILKGDPFPNLRATEFVIKDAETHKVVGSVKQTDTTSMYVNNTIDSPTIVTKLEKNNEGKPVGLEHDKEYYIEAKAINMKGGKPTGVNDDPIHFFMKHTWLTKAEKASKIPLEDKIKGWMKKDGSNLGNASNSEYIGVASDSYKKNTLLPNSSVNINTDIKTNGKWTFTVPKKAEEEIKLRFEIPVKYYYRGDNFNTDDDFLEIVLPIDGGDIGTLPKAELIDVTTGKVVDEVEPKKSYKIRYTVFSKKHKKDIGEPNNPDNPFIGLEVVVDNGKTKNPYDKITNKPIKPESSITIETDPFPAETNCVTTTWQIRQLHRDKKQSIDASNDGPMTTSWCSDINISVDDFVVNPAAIKRASNAPAGTTPVIVKADIHNSNPTNETKLIPVRIRGLGKTWTWEKSVGPNQTFKFEESLGTLPVNFGNNNFTIEVNYPVRKYEEYRMNGEDPYKDNIDYSSLLVERNTFKKRCENIHTENEWEQTYTLTDRWHQWTDPNMVSVFDRYVTETYVDEDGKTKTRQVAKYKLVNQPTHFSHVTAVTKETRSHFEKYKVDKIMFKSKLTQDKYGGSGWVDIKNGIGPVKAGYGFDIYFDIKYETNANNIPHGWSNYGWGYSGDSRSVFPGVSPTPPPTLLHVEMPFSDESGKDMYYKLSGQPIGAWYNQTVRFTMPSRSDKGKGTSNKIYVNELAKDNKYYGRIDTEDFFGYPVQPNSTKAPPFNLCDTANFGIEIKGANSDDVKTHIVQ